MDKELLSIVEALSHWKHCWKGTKYPIQIYTDHYNLCHLNILEQISECLA